MGRKTNITPVAFKQAIGAEVKALRKKHQLTQRLNVAQTFSLWQ